MPRAALAITRRRKHAAPASIAPRPSARPASAHTPGRWARPMGPSITAFVTSGMTVAAPGPGPGPEAVALAWLEQGLRFEGWLEGVREQPRPQPGSGLAAAA